MVWNSVEERFFDWDLLGVASETAAEYSVAGRKFGVGWGGDDGAGEFEAEDEGRTDEGAIVLVFASTLLIV